MRTSAAALTIFALAGSPILGAPTSPDPSASDVALFPSSSPAPSLPNSPNLAEVDIPSFSSLHLLDNDEDGMTVHTDDVAQKKEVKQPWDKLVQGNMKNQAIVDTEKSNGALGARPYMAKVRKTAPTDERTYEEWLRVQKITPPTIGSVKKQSQYDNTSTSKSTKPQDVELLRKVNETLHGVGARSVTKLFSAPSHASQPEDQSVPFRPKMDLSNLPAVHLDDAKRNIETGLDSLNLTTTPSQVPNLTAPKAVGKPHRMRRTVAVGHGLSRLSRGDVVEYHR